MRIGRFENPSVESRVIDTREGEMDTRSRSKESIETRTVDTSAVSLSIRELMGGTSKISYNMYKDSEVNRIQRYTIDVRTHDEYD